MTATIYERLLNNIEKISKQYYRTETQCIFIIVCFKEFCLQYILVNTLHNLLKWIISTCKVSCFQSWTFKYRQLWQVGSWLNALTVITQGHWSSVGVASGFFIVTGSNPAGGINFLPTCY